MKLLSNGKYLNRFGPVVSFADGTRARLVYHPRYEGGMHVMTYVHPLSHKIQYDQKRRMARKG